MLLLSSLFTVIWGVYKSSEASTMMEIGSESNVTLTNVNIDKIDDISNNILIEDVGTSEQIGNIANGSLQELNSKLIYGDYKYINMKYINIEQGHIPVDKDEVLVSRKMLNLLDKDIKTGSSINLRIEVNDGTYLEKEFIVSGIYDGKINSRNNDVLISKKFLEEMLKERQESLKNIGKLEVKLKSTFFIEKQIEKIEKDIDEEGKINADINWTYEFVFNEEVYFSILLIVLLILLAGYLIMFNIFNMSIVQDIRFYGILKTLGTTNEQVKRILYRQFIYILIMGIPIGSILGYSVGKIVLPMINNIILDDLVIYIETELTINLLIYLFSALFTYIVVIISVNKTYKIAEKISAIEAIQYNEANISNSLGKINFNGKIHNIPLIKIMRNKKKALLLVISLSIGIILFNVIYNIVFGFNKENYINDKMEVEYDYRIENKYFASLASNRIDDNTGVSDDLINKLYDNGFIKDGGGISIINCNEYDSNMSEENNICLLGIDDFFIDKYERYDTVTDLKNGNYIILNNSKKNNYSIGDSIVFNLDGSVKEEFKIIGFLNFWQDLSLNISEQGEAGIIWSGNIKNIPVRTKLERYYFDTEKNIDNLKIDNLLKSYVNENDSSIIYKSKERIEKRYNSMKEYYLIVGSIVVVLVGAVGIFNYINSIFTEMISSVKTLALLESVGITKKEIRIMFVCKGLYYSLFTTIFHALFMIIINLIYGKAILTVMPIFISIPLLLCFSVIVPLISYNKIKKDNMISYLRVF